MKIDEQEVLDALIAARRLIADKRRWTQNVEAETRDGDEVDPWSPEAVMFCAVGSVRRAAAENPTIATTAIALLDEEVETSSVDEIEIIEVNDDGRQPERAHRRVMLFFTRTINRLRDRLHPPPALATPDDAAALARDEGRESPGTDSCIGPALPKSGPAALAQVEVG